MATPATAAPAATAGSWRPRPGRLIGDVIVELGFAERDVVEAAVVRARDSGRPTGQILLETGALTAPQLARAIAERFELQHLDLSSFEVDMTAANLVASGVARRLNAVPVGFTETNRLLVAMADPSNVLAIDDISMMTDYQVQPGVATEDDIFALIGRLSQLDDAVNEAVEEDEEEEEPAEVELLHAESAADAPTIKLVRSIIAQAIERGASDLHFDPEEDGLQVRFRIDGVMTDSTVIPRKMRSPVISRIKILADLDISERRLPQDGRVGLLIDDRKVDLRVVVLPLVGSAESVVMRILDTGQTPLDLEQVGMKPAHVKPFRHSLEKSHGGVLVTGPTGSGKTTTLYAALAAVQSREKTIVTIEDPVEYRVAGIKQVQVNEKTGLSFATGLRSMMRADPDIIMVGEIRDRESAQIAVEAALTGHLVLSTLHTNDAPAAISRLLDMNIEPFLVASAINCVVAQRLGRRLCEACKKRVKVPAAEAGLGDAGEVEVYEPEGCQRCAGTGYSGRMGLFEVMPVTEEIRALVVERAPAHAIAAKAEEQGMQRLADAGLQMVRDGRTSLAEVARVIGA